MVCLDWNVAFLGIISNFSTQRDCILDECNIVPRRATVYKPLSNIISIFSKEPPLEQTKHLMIITKDKKKTFSLFASVSKSLFYF